MAESFSNRHGYRSADAEITVHEDAPENLRYAIPLIGQDIGMSPSVMRRITASCCQSFSPKTATWGRAARKSFVTTVVTPRK